ncbi:nuclear pore complex protein NUP1 [Prunus yedoensis var. nudiflora]|uniref:Nuclear pore complex protein NUP1 n=1 Tax=Prunus yedoensis var. nudiflora TaxID=2094558 RepID=A0A314UZQ8_PRUYE|nr:nuclear pore complex protein NUP1 [Prunus yedoensis var. nudiflora]
MNNGEDSTTEKKGFVPNVQPAVSTASNSVFHPPQKKGAFRMSVLEDYLELDDDDNSEVETFSTDKSSVATATVTLEKPPAFSALSAESMLAENGANSTGTSASSYSKMDSDAASPVFNYVSKSVDEVSQPQFAFASSPAVDESVDVKSGAFSVPKPESSSRSV